jgi:hypothetical protein
MFEIDAYDGELVERRKRLHWPMIPGSPEVRFQLSEDKDVVVAVSTAFDIRWLPRWNDGKVMGVRSEHTRIRRSDGLVFPAFQISNTSQPRFVIDDRLGYPRPEMSNHSPSRKINVLMCKFSQPCDDPRVAYPVKSVS